MIFFHVTPPPGPIFFNIVMINPKKLKGRKQHGSYAIKGDIFFGHLEKYWLFWKRNSLETFNFLDLNNYHLFEVLPSRSKLSCKVCMYVNIFFTSQFGALPPYKLLSAASLQYWRAEPLVFKITQPRTQKQFTLWGWQNLLSEQSINLQARIKNPLEVRKVYLH